jgi:dihydrofolate reductase
MKKLILQMQSSLDGFVATTSDSTSWLLWDFSDQLSWDAELNKEFSEIIASVDCILLSANMAEEGYIEHWSGMADRHSKDSLYQFAESVKNADKFIVNRHTARLGGSPPGFDGKTVSDAIRNFKNSSSGNMICFGGARFASWLLKDKLVDELQLFVNPVILDDGLSILATSGLKKIALISARSYSCGMAVLKYALT